MSAQLTPWSRAILDVLADGRWHTLDELVAKASPQIPPGRAVRTAERLRKRRNPDERTKGDAYLAGCRYLVRHYVGGFVRKGRVERVDGRYRLAKESSR